MARGEAQIDVDQPVDAVWEVVRDFGGIGTWMPGIDSCTAAGDERTLSLMGMEIVERLYGTDEEARTTSYGIVGGGLTLDHHRATIAVHPAGDGTHVTWTVDVEPDTMLPIMVQTYQGALEALAKRLAG